ncbi:inversin [Eurytemora carolleeae]|uniref:inversin n=1 Tax=Eurytemora carolleeae TaxID=1294199 RepID=UPI000C77DC0E|nr:inversin [Eurytemora carolleeae]|eukprot:XP_023345062.1 inversin-like [Eurytemora affinis]
MGQSLSGQQSCFFPDDDETKAPPLFSCLTWEREEVRAEQHGYLLPHFRGGGGASWTLPSRCHAFAQTEEEADSGALLVAAFNGRIDKVIHLLSKPGTNPNVSYSNGNTPLIMAVQENHTHIVKLLLERPDIKVNQRGQDGHTALIRACYERSDIVDMLLRRPSIDVNLATYYGTTALTYAIRNGNIGAVLALINHPGIDINHQSKHGENALFEAVSYKRKDIVELLIHHGNCNVDIVDLHDRTPFLIACQYGFQDIALYLIEVGCDTTCQDDCGRNGLYHALKRNRDAIVHAILDRKVPYTLRAQCRTVIRAYARSMVGPGNSVQRVIRRIPRTELPYSLISYLAFETT